MRALALLLAGVVLHLGTVARADDAKRAEPEIVVHLPVDEMDVLLEADRRGVVLRYEEYRRLLERARAQAAGRVGRPPEDGALAHAKGSLTVGEDDRVRVEVLYRVAVLASGPSHVPFDFRGIALEAVEVDGPGRYEEREGRGRLRFDEPGSYDVSVRGWIAPTRTEDQRRVGVRLPPASAMAIDVRFPPAVTGHAQGEGAALPVATKAEEGGTIPLRPALDGALELAWGPASRGAADGPPLIDVDTRTLHAIERGLIHTQTIVRMDVLRAPTRRIDLLLPPTLAIRSVSGPGLVGSSRSEDRTRLTLQFEQELRGRVEVVIAAEMPFEAADAVVLPGVGVDGAVRHRADVAIDLKPGVVAEDVTVEGGRRFPALRTKDGRTLLHYGLARADGRILVDLLPGETVLEAASTYYLNLTEPARTLVAAITYQVAKGKAFRLMPRFPTGYDLLDLRVDGRADGFERDRRPDGTVEIRLARGVAAGQRVALVATLERSGVDWVPESGSVDVALDVPRAGAAREEGYVGVGADASFQVLDTRIRNLVSVGAAELTSRGVTPAGLVYGYRLDGEDAGATLVVTRRTPRVRAEVVARVQPNPRRLDVTSFVLHRIERAGVRRLLVDVPAWAGDDVRIEAPDVVATNRLEAAEGVAEGFARWEISLAQRVLGNHRLLVQYGEDQQGDDWRIPDGRPVAVRVPLEQVARSVIVTRAEGLEVDVSADAERADLADLPPLTVGDPLLVRDVVRLGGTQEGPGIAVHKHEGAPVLDAIATRVDVRTAVATEGILRTRARIHLFNVGLQFVRVALPRGSELVGAVVDGKSVKPLVDDDGVLRVPVPRSASAGAKTVADLTYDTRLVARAEGDVRVPAPDFPGLEVLLTTQQVAFDPGIAIARVEGDFGAVHVPAGPRFRPWVASFAGLLATFGAKGVDAAAPGTIEMAAPVRATRGTTADRRRMLEAENAEAPGTWDAFEARDDHGPEASIQVTNGLIASAAEEDMRVRRLHEEAAKLQREVGRAEVTRLQGLRNEAVPAAQPEPVADPGDTVPFSGEAPPEAAPADFAPPVIAAGDPWGAPKPAGAPPAPGVEGPGEPVHTLPPKLPPRRKGLLSLDVPVLLSPNSVRGQRLGSGGAMDLAVVDAKALRSRYAFFAIAFFTVGLVFATRGRRHAWTALATLAALAVLVFAILGSEAALVGTALADAATALAGVLLVRWAARRLVRMPRASAALVLFALLAVSSGAARADEIRCAEPPVEPVPERVYVPYDPADPTVPRADDRVFLPMETYLALRRLAHPEDDPEVVELGRVVALVGAEHAVRMEGRNARVASELSFVKRGDGVALAKLAFEGVAIQRATLDGAAVPLIMKDGVHHVPLEASGDHTLVLDWVAPVTTTPDLKRLAFSVPPFAGAVLSVVASEFDGRVSVDGASVVSTRREGDPPTTFARVALGGLERVVLTLAEPEPAEPAVELRTRADSRVVHSIRDDGTESEATVVLHVLQGEARFVELDLPEAVEVLSAAGDGVARWESVPGGVRLTFAGSTTGSARIVVRAARSAAKPARVEDLPTFAVRDATGERGSVVVNADPSLRVEPRRDEGLLRTATPRDEDARGADRRGRVAGAWTFAARPTSLSVEVTEVEVRLALETREAVVFGDDHVRTHLAGRVRIDPARPVGELVFRLPGPDPVRLVQSEDLQAWWTEGEGDDRRLHLRYADLKTGDVGVGVFLDRRLAGLREAIPVPRWALEGAQRDHGELVISALPDVEVSPGALPGLRSIPITPSCFVSPLDRAEPRHAFAWETTMAASLPVALGTPPLEVEAVVVTSIAPSDDVHRLDHLVLFDVRRGLTDAFQVFVPDGGFAADDFVRTRDLREVRKQRVSRRGPDGEAVEGTLYSVRLQAPRGGIVELTITQTVLAEAAVRVVRPEAVRAVQYFGLVRSFLDGEVAVRPTAGSPAVAAWEDLPFLPTGIEREDVVSFLTSRAPYVVAVTTQRHGLEQQAEAVVRAAQADLVVGRDGQVRARVTYRLFNRSRQFLRLRMPPDAVLYGTTAANQPVKPLEGGAGDLLIPIPKVPLGGSGYPVTLLYRGAAGPRMPEGALELVLPTIVGVDVDRTVVRVFAPKDFEYEVDTAMIRSESDDLAAELAEAAVSEARQILEVAENGTLEQRQLATMNAGILVKEAQDLNEIAGQKRAGLNRELTQVDRQYDETVAGLRRDLESQARNVQDQELEILASNAAPVLALEATPAQSNDMGEVTGETRAQWRYNPTQVGQGAEKQAVKQLKERLGRALRDRTAQEQGQVEDATRAQQVPTFGGDSPQLGALFKNLMTDVRDGALDPEAVPDDNFRLLNDALVVEQRKNRQIGAAPGAAAAQAGQTLGVDGYGDWGAGRTTTAAPNPSAGIYFHDGQGGDFRARTESTFSLRGPGGLFAETGVAALDDVTSGLEDGAGGGGGEGRRGLMGVDVALPRDGRVFLFRSLREGAPIRLEASAAGPAPALRWIVFLIAVAGVAAVLVGLNRRAAGALDPDA